MIDEGVSPKRASNEPDPVLGSLDGAPVFPDDPIGGALPETVIDFGESPLDGPEPATSSIAPELALPEDLWGEPREGAGPADALDLQLGAETPVGEDLWRPAEGVDDVLDQGRDPEGLEVDAFPVGGPMAPRAQRRPQLAPAPVALGRSHGLRRSLENLHLNRRVAAAGLAGIAVAGLFATLATRSSEDAAPQRQVISAGTRPVASVPASSVPVSTTTTVAGTLPEAGPAPVAGEAPTTVAANGSPPPPTIAGQVATNRSPAPSPASATSATAAPPRPNPTVAASQPAQSPPPPAPPATQAPATWAIPDEEPDSPPTTRRPRVTIPETTAVPNTTSTTKVPPADE